jgi:hypothetical protein
MNSDHNDQPFFESIHLPNFCENRQDTPQFITSTNSGHFLMKPITGNTSVAELQMTVGGAWSSIPFLVRILLCVKHVAHQIADLRFIGVICTSPNTLVINTSILAPFLGIKRNALNKIFRKYGFALVPASAPLKDQRRILNRVWPGCPPDAAWSTRVFYSPWFSPNMSEQEALLIAQEMRANRRIPNVSTPPSACIVEDSSLGLQNMNIDDDWGIDEWPADE